MFAMALCAHVARAQNYQRYDFTGAGTGGVTASGSVIIDSNSVVNGYYANGAIYSQGISLAIGNISTGGGPATVTFDRTDPLSNSIESTFLYVAGTTPYFGPRGEYDYVNSHRYILSNQTQPVGTYYQSDLYYDLTYVSTITWSGATLVAVPEPTTCAMAAGLGALGLVALRRRRTA